MGRTTQLSKPPEDWIEYDPVRGTIRLQPPGTTVSMTYHLPRDAPIPKGCKPGTSPDLGDWLSSHGITTDCEWFGDCNGDDG